MENEVEINKDSCSQVFYASSNNCAELVDKVNFGLELYVNG